MDAFWLEIIGVLLLILLVGFFSATEVAVLSTRKSRMQELAEEGDKQAASVLAFLNNPELFLASIHVGNILSLILASILAGLLGFQHLAPALKASDQRWVSEASSYISLGTIVLAIAFLVVVFGELVPKSLALRSAESVALRVAPMMSLFATVIRIPARILTAASNLVLKPFKDSTTFTESRISEEEFKLMLEEGTKTGVIDETEHELIESIFEFTDTTAKEVMIPRPDMVAVDINMSRDIIIRIVLEEGYSRMPVYSETIDNIIGIIYTKDLLGLLEHRNVIILEDIIHPPYFVPETTKISHLLRDFQKRKIHLAIVNDEFGGTEGIVTMEDIIEEIVGEIHDEYDEEVKDIEQAADGSFLVNGRISIKDLNERFVTNLPEEEEYDTLSGFLHKLTGRIPDLNETITHENLSMTIVKKSQRRIRLVRLKKREEAPPEKPPAE
jgi:putative hemolysin